MEYEYFQDFSFEIEVIADYLKSKKLEDPALEKQTAELRNNLSRVFQISQNLQQNIDKLEEINFTFSLQMELWDGVRTESIEIDGFKKVPLMFLLRKIHDILIKNQEKLIEEGDFVKININIGVFNLLLGTFGVNSVELFNQRLKQFETSDIELKFELESDEAKNLYLLKISKDFFDQQFSYATKDISVKDEGLFALSKEEISELNEKIIDQIDSIQIKMKVLLEKGGEFEELDESALQKKSKIKTILRKLETEYEEYLELEEYYLSNKKDIDFLQKNIEYSPESKFIVKFIHELSEIEKEYYDITQLRQKLGINFPTIRFSLADLGFYAKTDQALGKDYIEIGNEELKWYISHFPEDSERLIKTLSLRKYKDSIKYLGTKRLAQFIRHGYFYFHQLEEEDANDIFVKTGVARGWVDNIKKQLPLARKKILSNK